MKIVITMRGDIYSISDTELPSILLDAITAVIRHKAEISDAGTATIPGKKFIVKVFDKEDE